MPSLLGKRAVVVGAGIGGLTAAGVLADYFERVVVLERDVLPEQTMRATPFLEIWGQAHVAANEQQFPVRRSRISIASVTNQLVHFS
jgi:flavin-dependent dehydrogenase